MLRKLLIKRYFSVIDAKRLESTFLQQGVSSNIPVQDLFLQTDFISDVEEQSLINLVDKKLRRVKYETSHFDNVITGYREIRISINTDNGVDAPLNTPTDLLAVVDRMRQTIQEFASDKFIELMPLHVLDLAKNGRISAHVDHRDYCGRLICGLSLISDSVMTFRKANIPDIIKEDAEKDTARLLLPRKSLYIMRDKVRYDYSHEISPNEKGLFDFQGKQFPSERRVSLLLRDKISQ